MQIWKYSLDVVEEQDIWMQEGAVILDAQVQLNQICIWTMVDEYSPYELRCFNIYGTGHVIPDNPGKYISTVQMTANDLVFHLFEIKERSKKER